eukprot:CAMPEP_0206231562 /NCGR_PEP_ID=MMETSP0047_2-20121206/10910_1 /ASSEMBLY_ACC=CAM_ASM_000192 /TAXON_ID=195065 /ORGANISM="Chroomonas mesostigmatica_cf, Strain CCMP1168" /LENGTH=218 /DNA_ID=CAMNT_0053655163 /DNA_START=654 /DNA_END=1307 /DNA_ORIENTATION=-
MRLSPGMPGGAALCILTLGLLSASAGTAGPPQPTRSTQTCFLSLHHGPRLLRPAAGLSRLAHARPMFSRRGPAPARMSGAAPSPHQEEPQGGASAAQSSPVYAGMDKKLRDMRRQLRIMLRAAEEGVDNGELRAHLKTQIAEKEGVLAKLGASLERRAREIPKVDTSPDAYAPGLHPESAVQEDPEAVAKALREWEEAERVRREAKERLEARKGEMER